MGSKSKDKRNKTRYLGTTRAIQTIRDAWTQADPLLVLLASLEQDLEKRYHSFKILGGTKKAEVKGALALIRTLARSILAHRIIGDLIPLKTMSEESNVQTATEALEKSQEDLRKITGDQAKDDPKGPIPIQRKDGETGEDRGSEGHDGKIPDAPPGVSEP